MIVFAWGAWVAQWIRMIVFATKDAVLFTPTSPQSRVNVLNRGAVRTSA